MSTENQNTTMVETSQKNDVQLRCIDLSIIVPTRNEAGNVVKLLEEINKAMEGNQVEVIFVDDSTDNTPDIIKNSANLFDDLQVQLIHRLPDQRVGGLGGAVVAGLLAAHSEYACVMDGDLQHPPSLLPNLLSTAMQKKADLVVATRRSNESRVTGLNTARNFISRTLDLIARGFFPRQLKGVSDPLTGFFLLRLEAVNIPALKPKGFKILLEILVRNPDLKKAEIPFNFGERFAGNSKASAKEVFKYLNLLWSLRFGEQSIRLIEFAIVGASGVLVNSLALYLGTDLLKVYYLYSAAIATIISTAWNFGLNEAWVYRGAAGGSARIKRFGSFFAINLIALTFKGAIDICLYFCTGCLLYLFKPDIHRYSYPCSIFSCR